MKVVERNERSVATKFEMKVIRRKACKTAYTPTLLAFLAPLLVVFLPLLFSFGLGIKIALAIALEMARTATEATV